MVESSSAQAVEAAKSWLLSRLLASRESKQRAGLTLAQYPSPPPGYPAWEILVQAYEDLNSDEYVEGKQVRSDNAGVVTLANVRLTDKGLLKLTNHERRRPSEERRPIGYA